MLECVGIAVDRRTSEQWAVGQVVIKRMCFLQDKTSSALQSGQDFYLYLRLRPEPDSQCQGCRARSEVRQETMSWKHGLHTRVKGKSGRFQHILTSHAAWRNWLKEL